MAKSSIKNLNEECVEMQFDFKEALENTKRNETDEEFLERFLQSIIFSMRDKKISIQDMYKMYFYILMEKGETILPLVYGVYVSYIPCQSKENEVFDKKYLLHSCSKLPYAEASLLLKMLVDKLTNMGYQCNKTIFNPYRDVIYVKEQTRELISISV